jgi:hypothetical protein
MNSKEKLDKCANEFSTNKATNKAYHKIFELIYVKNIVNKENNNYGYSEIHSSEFKKISKRKYNLILQHLFKNNLIYTNIPLNIGHTLGAKSIGGEKIIRGYKIDNSLNYKDNSLNTLNTLNSLNTLNFLNTLNTLNTLNSFNSLSFLYFTLPHFSINKGVHFLTEEGKYDIEKIYSYIDIDRRNIPYIEGSIEWNRLAKIWNKHSLVKKIENRLYSWFHYIHGEERNIFTINESNLREAFDVPACNFCILAKLLENIQNINQIELKSFQEMIRYDYIYERIAKFIGIELTNLNKKQIKAACQHWLNIRKIYKHNGSKSDKLFNDIDRFFK